jgi:hypothetical protein
LANVKQPSTLKKEDTFIEDAEEIQIGGIGGMGGADDEMPPEDIEDA